MTSDITHKIPHPSSEESDPVESVGKKPFLDSIRISVREKVEQVLSPVYKAKNFFSKMKNDISNGVRKVMSWFQSSPGISEDVDIPKDNDIPNYDPEPYPEIQPEIVEESPKSPWDEANEALEKHMDAMAKNFFDLQNKYRENFSHKTQIKISPLTLNPQLIEKAKIIAKKQVEQGSCEHTSYEYRKENGIDGENLVSDFSTPAEALQAFIKSEKHHKYLTGNFDQCGCAIRSGIEKTTGKQRYFLVVLFSGGDKKPQSFDDKSKDDFYSVEIPGNESKPPILQGTSLDECLAGKLYLEKYFEVLDEKLKAHPDIKYDVNSESTKKLQEIPQRPFCLDVQVGDTKILYQVFSEPPVLKRIETIDGEKKVVEVPFEDFIEDATSLSTHKIL